MAVIIAVLLVCCILALEWLVRARMLTPLPESVQCVFSLDGESEASLECAVRGYRFLRRHGFVRGPMVIELRGASAHARRCAQLLSQRGDITIREIEA